MSCLLFIFEAFWRGRLTEEEGDDEEDCEVGIDHRRHLEGLHTRSARLPNRYERRACARYQVSRARAPKESRKRKDADLTATKACGGGLAGAGGVS